MVSRIKQYLVLIISIVGISSAQAQFGLSGGTCLLKGFGTAKPFIGLQIGGEMPRDDFASLFGRISFYGKQWQGLTNTTYMEVINTNEPSNQAITYDNSMNYTVIEGGNRFYIGDGYDSGFGAYGGGTLQAIFNTVKRDYNYESIDMSKYQLPIDEPPKGSIFSLGFGLSGGVKNTFAGVGTAYFDVGFSYAIMNYTSNLTASSENGMYSRLFFTFCLGFRKDFY
jgi:hypothetical protein